MHVFRFFVVPPMGEVVLLEALPPCISPLHAYERSSLPSKNFPCISMDVLQRVIVLLNRNLPTRCHKTSLRAFVLLTCRMLFAHSIGAPIGAGKISWEKHYHSRSIGVTRKAGWSGSQKLKHLLGHRKLLDTPTPSNVWSPTFCGPTGALISAKSQEHDNIYDNISHFAFLCWWY